MEAPENMPNLELQVTDTYMITDANDTRYDNDEARNATLPPEMRFTNHSLALVIAYSICFLVSALGNLTVFVTLCRGRHRKSRIALMIFHLSVADLLVTFIMIPVEISWRITVQWIAGNSACKIFAFLRVFSLYLSSNILVCISLDRYYAVLQPLRVNEARRRGKVMLGIAWISSAIYALPQSFIFHVASHPNFPDFQQCVSIGTEFDEAAYTIFCVLAMYFIPLIIICWAYINILREINSKRRENRDQINSLNGSNGTLGSSSTNETARMRLRRSDMRSIERARSRTLRMTVTIVVVFIVCWTPYVTMLLWYVVDRESAEKVDPKVQVAVFIMAVANSCANPLVYGSYAVNLREEWFRCFRWYGNNSGRRPSIELGNFNRGVTETPSRNRVAKSPGVSNFIE